MVSAGLKSARSAVFIDRDGVLNRALVRDGKPYAPRTLEEFELLPDVSASVRALKKAGYPVIVVTNQPDVATGQVDRATVEQMHEKLRAVVPVDDIKVCYHVESERCPCRKPKPGLLLEAAQERDLDLRRSFMIGDRWRDIEAGAATGCFTIFLDYGYFEPQPKAPNATVGSLAEAVSLILSAPPR